MNELVEKLKKIREAAQSVVSEMRSADQPSRESCGIAYVHADWIVDELNRIELDLICDEVTA